MGLEWSTFNLLGAALGKEKQTRTFTDGTTEVCERRNPWVAGVAITSATLIFVMYTDSKTGLLGKILGKTCSECGRKLLNNS